MGQAERHQHYSWELKMKTSAIVSLIAILFMTTITSYGQQQKGDTELGFYGMYFTNTGSSDFKVSMANIAFTYGKYFTDNWEFAVAPTLTVTTTTMATPVVDYVIDPITGLPQYTTTIEHTSSTKTTFGMSWYITYSLLAKDAKTVPYFGAAYYRQDYSNKDDHGAAGINAGAKYFFSKKTAMDLKGNYLFSLNKGQSGGQLLFTVGLSFLF
jgi:hypothetical protein